MNKDSPEICLQITGNLLGAKSKICLPKKLVLGLKNAGTHKSYLENFSKTAMIGTSTYRGLKLTSISSNKLKYKPT